MVTKVINCLTLRIQKFPLLATTLVGRISNFRISETFAGHAQQLTKVSLQSDQQFSNACEIHRLTEIHSLFFIYLFIIE